MQMQIYWNNCYLEDLGNEDMKDKVIQSLLEDFKMNKYSKGELVTLFREDHSTAFEQFEILETNGDNYYKLKYYGGGS